MLFRNDSGCRHVWNREENSTFSWTATTDQASIINRTYPLTDWQMYVVFLLIGLVVIILAKVFIYIRVHVYRDKDNLDTNFNAGGKVTAGLTATTIVSQWTWAATLLQSSAVAAKYGISGSFWYAAGATIQILLFSMVSVQLRIRAPGAKTFLQVIRARFGARTHLVFCAFALLTNVIVTGMLMQGGATVMIDLVEGLSLELSTCLVALIILSYTYIGGLGATFYVSYVNTSCMFVIMFIFLVKIYHDIGDSDSPVGSTRKIYDSINCTLGPDGNLDHSFLTMVSRPGLMFGIINIVGNFGTVFVDQSYWQSSVAAKPRQGVWGFLCGGLVWFAVPFTFATTIGMAYLSISSNNRQPLLDSNDVDKGLVAPAVAQSLLGDNGALMMVLLIMMAVTSTGSAEVIAVTSILICDIYQIYLKPYRVVHDANSCILCGKQNGRFANPRDKCICVSRSFCKHCSNDDEQRAVCKQAVKGPYCCTTHGAFRTYMDYVKSMKDWCLVWTTLCIIPLTIALDHTQISMGWLYLFMGVLIGSAVIPIVLCMFWDRLTGFAMVSGALVGLVSGLVVWLCVAASKPGGLSDFIASTGDEITMLCGNVTSILVGGVVTVIVSLLTPCIKSGDVTTMALSDHPDEVWEKTRNIDNPLNPWAELYAKDLKLTDVNCLDKRPSLADVKTAFRGAKLLSYIASFSLALILVIVWPASTISIGVMDFNQFNTWITCSEIWGIVAAILIIIIPVIMEVDDIRKTLKEWHIAAHVSPNARWKSETSEAAVPGRDSKQVDVNDIVGDNVLEIDLDESSSGNNTVF